MLVQKVGLYTFSDQHIAHHSSLLCMVLDGQANANRCVIENNPTGALEVRIVEGE